MVPKRSPFKKFPYQVFSRQKLFLFFSGKKREKKKVEVADLRNSMIPTDISSPTPETRSYTVTKSRSLSHEDVRNEKEVRMRSFSDPDESMKRQEKPQLMRRSSVARVKIEKEYDSKYTVLRKLKLGIKVSKS
jgi:hypothetical protein